MSWRDATRIALALSLGFTGRLVAQVGDHKLDRLDPQTRVAVQAIIDSAKAAKLPTDPLVDKALEGVAKGSDGEIIVAAVRHLSAELGQARRVLGPKSPLDEIKAAATALHVGVTPRDLALLRQTAPTRILTLPLAVLTDLVTRAVPVDTASKIVVAIVKAGVRDPDLSVFQRNVRVDIDRGADATSAATTRARGIVLRVSAPSRPRSGE